MDIQMIYGIVAIVFLGLSLPMHLGKCQKILTRFNDFEAVHLEKAIAWLLDIIALMAVVGVMQIMNDVLLVTLGVMLVICLLVLMLQGAKRK